MTEQIQKPMEPVKKPSIFVCKDCKQNTVQFEKKPKEKPEKSDVLSVKLAPSKQKDSKYTVKLSGKSINFGQKSASDFTLNKNDSRKQLYINRHEKREKQFWSFEQDNLETASFWSRHLLWEFNDIFEAIKEIEQKTGCVITFTKATIEKHQRKLARLAKVHDEDEN